MKRILLVMDSGKFAQMVKQDLQKDYEILLCHDAETAGSLMSWQPDALVIELQLPGMDGLTFLEKLPGRPPVILTLAAAYSPYTAQKLYDLNVGYLVKIPSTLASVTDRLRDMLRERPLDAPDPQTLAAQHLKRLNISSEYGGGKYLRVGIPLFAQDPGQKMTMELYPAIAKICNTTAGSVEHGIRNTIKDAWNSREFEIWAEYFPGKTRCPSNKAFLSVLAEKLS